MALTHLQILAQRYPNIAAVVAELANLEAVLILPKPTVHVVSDVHGEDVKLRQVINNASGSLRPLFERLFAGRPKGDVEQLLTLVYYPHEAWPTWTAGASPARRRELLHWVADAGATVLRDLARRYSLKYVANVIPDPFDAVFRELVFADELGRDQAFLDRLLAPFLGHDRDGELVGVLAHVIRNLAVGELVVAGDLGDRGPRIDRVIEVIAAQPHVAITWGNHDADWIAASLGHPAAIATVVRLSLRYQRLAQLEDGYGISLAPVARLARDAYGDDPAECFRVKGEAEDGAALARMQKAIALLQFKLEGQLFDRRPEWQLAHRALLRRIDPAAGTVDIDGRRYPLRDTHFPTIDWADPHRLSDGEARCLAELTGSFTASRTLVSQMAFVVSHGQMSLRRDLCAIFHGCVPVDARGELLAMVIDGEPRRGKALFDAIEVVVQRAFRKGPAAAELDRDLIFYLWTGPLSPCFGKDRMATFETYFVADPATHEETKNPYFQLIHDPAFCARMLRELGVDEAHGFLVNGHVPVRLEAGETPIKRSGRAITIDGAFAAAYGDKGFSLVLDAQRIYLAQHHHFESAEAAVTRHADIVPTVSDVAVHERPRTVGDTEIGDAIRAEIAVLEELVRGFEANIIRERT
ncbi:MAG: fructose-1,6-bisphosphatase [Deltaproteobacteria bacterium]|nr:MAG: fructose-1,6-bisphosphatase [Deltaproteobacteria bacterium]TMQ21829.1 MAG: fructose-1,6-bisphosphatase [Deltaproteobacteria bacterium]